MVQKHEFSGKEGPQISKKTQGKGKISRRARRGKRKEIIGQKGGGIQTKKHFRNACIKNTVHQSMKDRQNVVIKKIRHYTIGE